MPTVAELAALDYSGPSPFAQGLLVSDYEREYLLHGEPIRWFRAHKASDYHPGTGEYSRAPNASRDKNGRYYVEQEYCDDGTTLVADVRVMVYQTHDEIMDSEFGLLPKGSTAISTIPSQIPLGRLDRIILTGRGFRARRQLVRGASSSTPDPIFNDSSSSVPTPVASIRRVWRDEIEYRSGIDYELASGGVHWLVAPTYDIEREASGNFDDLPEVNVGENVLVPTFVPFVRQTVGLVTTTYAHNIDYRLAAHNDDVYNAIEWLTGTRPAPGTEYQVDVRYWPETENDDGSMTGAAYGVEVAYNPVYTAVGSDTQPPRLDVAGNLMPLRMGLVKVEPGQ